MDESHTQHVAPSSANPASNPPPEQQVVVGSPEDEKPTREARKHNCKRKLRNAPVWIQAACTVALVGITWTYTHYASQQAGAAIKAADAAKSAAETADNSFKLTRERLEATDEAICAVNPNPEFGTDLEDVVIVDSGKTYAKHIKAHLEFIRTSLPSNKRLAVLKSIDISEDELRTDRPIRKYVQLVDFGKPDWERVIQTREGVEMTGTLEYDNGFGTIKHAQLCNVYIAIPDPSNPAQFDPANPPNIVECDRVPEHFLWIERLARLRKQEKTKEK